MNNKDEVNYDLQLLSPGKFKFEDTKEPEKIPNEYCRFCGKPVSPEAVICPACGVQLKELKSSPVIVQNYAIKSKAVAVVLAVFFSFWSWLYTYGKNSVKFWVSLICLIIVPIISIYQMVESKGALWFLPMLPYLLYAGIWIYAIVDNAVKPYKYFTEYPNK